MGTKTERLTTEQAAEIAGISPELMRRYCRAGRIGERVGRNFTITRAEVEAFAKQPRPRGRRRGNGGGQ